MYNGSMTAFRLILILMFFAVPSLAVDIEIGGNYGYKKSFFDSKNYYEQESTTASLSFYFWEKAALELSYTKGLMVRKEIDSTATVPLLRTSTVESSIVGGDFIFILTNRKAKFQPFLKAGLNNVDRKQIVQDEGSNPTFLSNSGNAPSYGVGLRYSLTDSIGLRMSYDTIQTPIGEDQKSDDVSTRVGISWIL